MLRDEQERDAWRRLRGYTWFWDGVYKGKESGVTYVLLKQLDGERPVIQ